MNRRRQRNLIIFTDLDGTLLDDRDYGWTAAQPALQALARAHCPLVIVTSKTRAEVEPILLAFGRREPFVVENGGAVYIPAGYFPFIPEGAVPERRGWHKVVLGTPRPRLVKRLTVAARRAKVQVRGFSQMPAREVRGSRFFHITGKNNKGVAVARVVGWLRRALGASSRTVGLGDCPNDIPLLKAVDQPILVARPGNRYDAETLAAVPRARRAGGVGPAGWNRAVLRLCGLASRPVRKSRGAGAARNLSR